jgi:hypothetical protein
MELAASAGVACFCQGVKVYRRPPSPEECDFTVQLIIVLGLISWVIVALVALIVWRGLVFLTGLF